ncbi:MAG: citryl-CoA lyase [Chloroflexia bacterium]
MAETWSQPISCAEPNRVLVRGYRIEELMGGVPFGHVVYLVLKGELPTPAQGRVLDAILVSCVDHGGSPPSTLAARTVASGGASLTAAVAAGLLAIHRHHGGAIEDGMRLLREAVARRRQRGQRALDIAREMVADYRALGKRLPGYGHRLHTADPRTERLLALAEEEGLAGEYVEMARAVQQALREALGRELPMNVDGAIAALLCELDLPPEVGNGFFALSRLVGLIAHVYDEQTHYPPLRPISPAAERYGGPAERPLPPPASRAMDARFFDRELYAVYRAVGENWGQEAWKVVWRAGEILFDEIEGDLKLETASPVEAVQEMARYLVKVGYLAGAVVRPVAADELEYEMIGPAILSGAERLVAEGGVPAHISTALIFAGLRKRFGLKVELIGQPLFTADGRAVERWKLTRISDEAVS